MYTGIESAVIINNVISDFFPVHRSVRQGCPLSMGLFILFQEPFYRAVVACRIIRPIQLPDSTEMKILGYADDSTILIRDDRSLLETFRIIQKFEKATGSKLNISKTKIYDTCSWQNRNQWPIEGLQSENEFFYALGIYHSTDYHKTVEKNGMLYKIK